MKYRVILILVVGSGVVTTLWALPRSEPQTDAKSLATTGEGNLLRGPHRPLQRFIF